MQDEPYRPRRDPDPLEASGHRRHFHLELRGLPGCAVGAVLLVIAVVVLAVVTLAGLIALSLAIWVMVVLAAIGAFSVLLRRRRF